ncbi:MAG: hypothetical protein PHR04_02555 [Syntrophomonadaceae bacterium]|nr:hypothetical protein [Syntrophomonadaceae bacterium]MDD3897531.1 hypothetical protein [Syntrophomonadaceae bacterium]
MKKLFPVVILVLGLLLINCSSLPAGDEASWTIKWNSNGSLDEKIIIANHIVVTNDQEWETSRSGNQVILSRHVNDWRAYGQLGDSLPITVVQKDYLLMKFASLTVKQEATPGSLFEQFISLTDARLSIEVPGAIRNSNAEASQNSVAVWNLDDLQSSPVKLDAVIFDGIFLGISFFVFCFIIIFIIYLRRIRRVHRLIAEEYSLERAALEFSQGENENNDNNEEEK